MSKIKQAILGSIIADSYCLGAHWIYDEAQLESIDFSWDELNAPLAMWHKGKSSGDLTHYGDHTLWLIEFLAQNSTFDVAKYAAFWLEKTASFTGYEDGSTRETIAALKEDSSTITGAKSADLSICGRIAPLLLVSNTREEFVSNARAFAALTHNDVLTLDAVEFFANVLYCVIDGQEIKSAIAETKSSKQLEKWIADAADSVDKDSFDAIRAFGPACGVDGGFAGSIHLLLKSTSLKEALALNAKAGGDSSARGMIVGMIMGANESTIPYLTQLNCREKLDALLAKF